MSMGDIIKTNRIRLGLSQGQLGERVGVNKAAVQKWESGAVENIKRSKIKQLSEIFGITPTELFGWSDEFAEKKHDNVSGTLSAIKELYGNSVADIFQLLIKLDFVDQARIAERISEMLTAEKYKQDDARMA